MVVGTTLAVIGVIFLATLVRSTLGFGEALVAVPLLAFAIPVEVAVPLATLVSITVAAAVLVQDWRHVHIAGAWRLVIATFVGIPLGLLVLVTTEERVVKAGLGAVILAFAATRLMGLGRAELKDDRRAWLFGLAAGVLGGAYGMNGPPLVVYGTLRRWSPAHFRATLQGYFLFASFAGVLGFAMAGLWTREVTVDYLVALPGALVAVALGRAIHRRIDPSRFVTAVHVALVAIALMLLVQAIRG